MLYSQVQIQGVTGIENPNIAAIDQIIFTEGICRDPCNNNITAVFRFLWTQLFKHLPPFDVLAPVNQSYEHDRTAIETFLKPPTYTDVFTSLSWLVSFHSDDYRSFDWRKQKHRIVFLFCASEFAENEKSQ